MGWTSLMAEPEVSTQASKGHSRVYPRECQLWHADRYRGWHTVHAHTQGNSRPEVGDCSLRGFWHCLVPVPPPLESRSSVSWKSQAVLAAWWPSLCMIPLPQIKKLKVPMQPLHILSLPSPDWTSPRLRKMFNSSWQQEPQSQPWTTWQAGPSTRHSHPGSQSVPLPSQSRRLHCSLHS